MLSRISNLFHQPHLRSHWLAKTAALILLCSFSSAVALAQLPVCKYDIAAFAVNTSAGRVLRPAAGAQVSVCPAGSLGTPCNPLVQLFDINGNIINNPAIADANGNYVVCVSTPGRYMIQVGGPGFQTLIQDQQIINVDPTNGIFTSLTVGSLTVNGSQTFGPNALVSSDLPLANGDTIKFKNFAGNAFLNFATTDPGVNILNAIEIGDTTEFLFPATFADGLAASPSISFTSETSSGFYKASAGNLAISILGTKTFNFSSSVFQSPALSLGTTPSLTGTIRLPNTGDIRWRNAANNNDLIGIQGVNTNVLNWGFNQEFQTNGKVQLNTGVPLAFTSDTGLSRDSAGVIDVGNGTQGDISGKVKASQYGAGTATPSASFHSKTATGGADLILEQTGDFSQTMSIKNTVQSWIAGLFQNVSEGFIIRDSTNTTNRLVIPTGSGTITVPNATDTIVGRATTDTLTNKTIVGTGASGTNTITLAPGKQLFTATGAGTFTIPAGVTAVKVTVTGAGGAGGGGTSVPSPGGGGGAGGTAIKWLTGLTPGNTISVSVGTGGTGVAGANNGNNGGNTTISSGTQIITTVTGNGGGGGSYGGGSTFAVGGSGGTATNGDLNYGGGAGSFTYLSGAGGIGGNSVNGGAGPVPGVSQAGGNGTAAGAGGGGAGGNGGNLAGGNGANGQVIFEWVN